MELKKLVYLYLMNYAKIQPRATLLVVNAFVMDCDHPNPLVRCLLIMVYTAFISQNTQEVSLFTCGVSNAGIGEHIL